MRRVAPRSEETVLSKLGRPPDAPKHKPFQEFSIGSLDELVKQLENDGRTVDILTIDRVPHLLCGKPLANILVQSSSPGQVPGDLLAIYQFCPGCRVAVRVL